jgi:beta-barrel assembly-enhancing protease
MKYMKLAGYDPVGAVTLQETFVRITNEKGSKQGYFDHMFASHPPSTERVEKNKEMLKTLGAGGELGEQTYRTRIAALLKAKPAYEKFDQATAALQKKDYASAATLAAEASKLLPQEGRFHELRGEIDVAQKRYKDAIPHYEQAIQYNPSYFGSYLGGGIAYYESGNKSKGQEWIQRSQEMLPTQPAAYYLGKLASDRGDSATALQHFQSAVGSDGPYAQLAAREYVSIGVQQRPEQFIAAGLQVDGSGRLVIVVQNRSPVPLKEIQITPVLVDASGRPVQTGAPLRIPGTLAPDQQIEVSNGVDGLTSEQRQALRFRVDGAKLAD